MAIELVNGGSVTCVDNNYNITYNGNFVNKVYACDTTNNVCTLVYQHIQGITVPDCMVIGFPEPPTISCSCPIGTSISFPGFNFVCKDRNSDICTFLYCRGNSAPLCTSICVSGSIPSNVYLIAHPQGVNIEQGTNNYQLWLAKSSGGCYSWNNFCSITLEDVEIQTVGDHTIGSSYTVKQNDSFYASTYNSGNTLTLCYTGETLCSCILYDLYANGNKVLSCVPASCINSL
jgi:hypothetical protein